MGVHSRLGASGAYRWMECPGSVRLEAELPDPPSSRWATEGTVAHAVCEWAVETRQHPNNLIGRWGNDNGDLFETEKAAASEAPPGTEVFEVTEEMADACEVYWAHIGDLIDNLQAMADLGEHDAPDVLTEVKFDLQWIRNGMFGTNDCCVFVPGEVLYVLDYKHGRGHIVEVEDNPQLKYYALGALRQLCWDEKAQDWNPELMPKSVELVVIQPRAKHPNGPVRSWTVTPNHLVDVFAVELQEAADNTAMPNAWLRAGDHCMFCKAKATCPEIQRAHQEAVQGIFDDMDVSDLVDDDGAPVAQDEALGKKMALHIANEGPERLADIMKFMPMFEEWIKAVHGYAQGIAESGQEVPGFKLVRGRAHRKWKDPKKTEALLDMFLEPEEYLTEPKLKSPAQMERVKADGKSIKASLTNLIETPQGALTLVPDTDTRDAIKVNVLDDEMAEE